MPGWLDFQWRYVHIDDRIPCDRKGRPIYAHGKDVNETWVMILEKAYAKLHGCYDNLKTGYIDYGLRDLTGGACIKFKWTDKPTAVCGAACVCCTGFGIVCVSLACACAAVGGKW